MHKARGVETDNNVIFSESVCMELVTSASWLCATSLFSVFFNIMLSGFMF